MEQLTAAIERLAREISSMGQDLKAGIGEPRQQIRKVRKRRQYLADPAPGLPLILIAEMLGWL
jgi:hypothetical protein